MPLQFNLTLLLSTVLCILGGGATTVLPKLIGTFSVPRGITEDPWTLAKARGASKNVGLGRDEKPFIHGQNLLRDNAVEKRIQLRRSFHAYFMVQGRSPTLRMGR